MRDLRALVVDDEPLARRRLRKLVDRARGVAWAGEAGTGEEALERTRSLRPDLVFLDVRMPGMSGLQVVERMERPAEVVFTTAHDDHAVQAFELHAADYLLKPISAERLQAAVDRVRELIGRGGPRVQRLFVRERGRIVPVPVGTIVRLEADGDYVHIHAGGRSHLVTSTLTELNERLDPSTFERVHRSHVVNLDRVESIGSASSGRLRLVMDDGSEVVASRGRAKELRGRVV